MKSRKLLASRKPKELRNKNELYSTPLGLTYELINNTNELDGVKTILEPCCGNYAISKVLKKYGYNVVEKDLMYGNDFLLDDYSNEKYDCVLTNPPFDLWNEFVIKAQQIADKVIVIGRVNYFGSHSRNVNGIWNNLSDIYIFDRQIEYTENVREDGKAHCGCIVSGWFVFKKNNKELPRLHILDIQKWILNKK